ncbi:MAG TPA: helix-turn-helix domain-containing protein [Chryseolinea sp.]|nr:helix-turn-helix domain-containing protein [Chryseolinea sp.]
MESHDKIGNPFEQIIDQLNRIESIVIHLKSQYDSVRIQNSTEENPEDNGIRLAMRITGLKKKTIYNKVNRREIPHAKKGRRLYFDAQELVQWIQEGKRKTIDELRTEVFNL